MQQLKTKTVYTEIPVSERLPTEIGYYPVNSKNIFSGNESIDDLRFTGEKFLEIKNWKHLSWLEKQDLFVFSKAELEERDRRFEFSEIELKRAREDIAAHENRIRVLLQLIEKLDPQPPTDGGISFEENQ